METAGRKVEPRIDELQTGRVRRQREHAAALRINNGDNIALLSAKRLQRLLVRAAVAQRVGGVKRQVQQHFVRAHGAADQSEKITTTA